MVAFFHRSTTAAHALKTKQEMLELPVHKLIHDVTTRWNTTYDMLERYVEQQAAIYSALMDKDVKKNVKDIAVLTDSEAKLAEDLIKILKPLNNVTTLMSTETSPSVSMIIPLQKMILKSMTPSDEDSATIKDAKAAITKDLEGRYRDPDLQDYLHRATALDPRFKSLPYLEEASLQKIYSDLTKEIMDTEEQVLWIYFIFLYIAKFNVILINHHYHCSIFFKPNILLYFPSSHCPVENNFSFFAAMKVFCCY